MKTNQFKLALLATLFVFSYGCSSSIQKADIPSSADPNEEISKLESDLSYGESNDFDVLARDDFQKSREKLKDARKKLRDNKSQEDVLDEVRYSRAYYERARTISTERKSKLDTVLEARSAALDAGVKRYPSLSDDWSRADKDTRSLAEKKVEDIKSEDVRKLQDEYADLQYRAIQLDYLGNAHAILEDAKKNNAKSRAPKSLKQAEIDYAAAENSISANRSNPSRFTPDVSRANESADRLRRVMNVAEQQGGKFNEDQAIQLVMQEDRIQHLDTELGSSEARTAQMANRLGEKNAQLGDAEKQVALQKAIDSARKEFKPSEADVYQQGDKLLIRVKSLSFKTGKSELPKNADPILNKIESIAKDLNASDVLVQGHTDSTGGQEVNQKLSEARAQEVADYFEKKGIENSKVRAEGYGDSVPLKPNNTKTGRAQNRRIDVVITPSSQL